MVSEASPALSMDRIVIVGAGQAGGDAAAALRMAGHQGPITLIGDEPQLPYSRPPLSKAFLLGQVEEEGLMLRTAESYRGHDIEILTGARVSSVNSAERNVVLEGGQTVPYDKLILATGGRPRSLPNPELSGARNVFTLRSIRDASLIRQRLNQVTRMVVIGGGYIGLEMASVARSLGVDVTLLEANPRLLSRVTSPVVSDFFHRLHQDEGVEILLNARIEKFETDDAGNFAALSLSDGTQIKADFLIAGIGLVPNTELASDIGLDVDNGIIVNEYLQTSNPDIYAIGDVARYPDQQHGGLSRLESVPNASAQARRVAANLAGDCLPYNSVPWFWSDQFDVKLQVVGLSRGYDELIVRRDPSKARTITVFYLKGGVVISADIANSPKDFAFAKKLVAAEALVDSALLANASISLRDLIPLPASS